MRRHDRLVPCDVRLLEKISMSEEVTNLRSRLTVSLVLLSRHDSVKYGIVVQVFYERDS